MKNGELLASRSRLGAPTPTVQIVVALLSHWLCVRHLKASSRPTQLREFERYLEHNVHVAEIWRYPVKSMAGESLVQATVSESGIAGDRLVQVYGARGQVVTARTHPGLLGHRATIDPAGEPLVDGRHWSDPTVLADVRRITGPHARLLRVENPKVRFDVLPLLVATDGAIAAFGRDRRRLRPNIIIGGVPGLDERHWPGGRLQIGEVVIEIDSLRGRCVMTTVDPESLAQDHDVLRDIVRRFGGRLALNAGVVRGGRICVGQEVTLIRALAGEPCHT